MLRRFPRREPVPENRCEMAKAPERPHRIAREEEASLATSTGPCHRWGRLGDLTRPQRAFYRDFCPRSRGAPAVPTVRGKPWKLSRSDDGFILIITCPVYEL
ncbi:hypothetical protein HPB50_002702 [Hyalomma asiaticum]|uniref:Uncharacterized protein n=1 Tax=Hyalomma asiaticum TaxID=266040 RepID=A0ACB7TE59_HYAAI|nr:hypothetical protein HPB50_002702 [Hyalomma asiaticum]